MQQFIHSIMNHYGEHSTLLALFSSFLIFYLFLRLLVFISPKLYHFLEKYRLQRNGFENKEKSISEINNKLDKLSASVESFIQFSNRRDDELSSKIDILFRKQEEIQHQQNEDKADSIRESILNFAERLRNNPDGDYSIEKFNQIFALGSKYKKIIEENEITNDVFVHDYEYIETQYNKRFNKDKE